MIEADRRPDAPSPAIRTPWQYSLRTLFAVTGVTAVFFSVARTLGYGDAVVTFVAFFILIGVVSYPRRVRWARAVYLTLLAFILIWANLRATGWQKLFGGTTPAGLDPVTAAMFWRGWPVSPFMVSLVHGMTYHPHGTPLALIFDGFIFWVILLAAKAMSRVLAYTVAWCCHGCLRSKRESDGGLDPGGHDNP